MFGSLDVWRFGCLEVWMFGGLAYPLPASRYSPYFRGRVLGAAMRMQGESFGRRYAYAVESFGCRYAYAGENFDSACERGITAPPLR